MENINWLPMIVAAFIPLVLGAIYYGPVFGKSWMDSLGYTEEDLRGGNPAVIYGSALLLAFILSMALNFTIDGLHKDINDAGELFLNSDNNFKHGAFHGFFMGLMIGIPVLITNSLFQRNSWKNIMINTGYWLLTFTIMGGLLDAWN